MKIKKYFDYFTNQLLQYDICTQYNFIGNYIRYRYKTLYFYTYRYKIL